MEVLEDIFSWIEALPPVWIYATILVIAYLENVVPPIPGDMVIVFGGYLVGLGLIDFTVTLVIAVVGGAVGFMTMYAGGRWLGYAMLDSTRLRWLPRRHIFQAQQWIRNYGYGVVLANRFLSGTRSVISIAVGMSHMSSWKVCLYATISAGLWSTILIILGYVVGDNWEVIGDYLKTYGNVVLVLVSLALAVLIVRYFFRQRRKRRIRSSSK